MPGNDELKFRVHCHAGDHGCLRVATGKLVVNVGQKVVRDGGAEMWDSVVVECSEEEDGSAMVRVLLCNPGWEEPLQIACVRSRPYADSLNQAAITCDLSCNAEP